MRLRSALSTRTSTRVQHDEHTHASGTARNNATGCPTSDLHDAHLLSSRIWCTTPEQIVVHVGKWTSGAFVPVSMRPPASILPGDGYHHLYHYHSFLYFFFVFGQ